MPSTKREDRIDEQYDDKFNRRSLQDQENTAGSSYTGAGIDQAEAFANDPANASKNIDQTRNRETENNQFGYSSSQQTSNSKKFDAKSFLKKKGPIGGVIGLIIGGAAGISLFTPGLVLIHIKENLEAKFDNLATAMQVRAEKVLEKKMAKCGDRTNPICKISKKLLGSMKDAGMEAVDKNGKPIDISGSGDIDPAQLEGGGFADPDIPSDSHGKKKITTKISEFSTKLKDNLNFKAKISRALHVRYSAAKGKAMGKIKSLFSLDFKGLSPDELEDKDKSKNKRGPLTKLSDKLGSKLSDSDSKFKSALKDFLEKTIKSNIEKAKGTGPAVGAVAVVNTVCESRKLPSLIIKTIKAIQLAALIPLAVKFLTVADKIKAGDASPEEVSTLASALTIAYVTYQGGKQITEPSAMDSFGMRYSLGIDKKPKNAAEKKKVQDATPGYGATNSLSGFMNIANNGAVKAVCNPLKAASDAAKSVIGSIPLVGDALSKVTSMVGDVASFVAGPIADFVGPFVSDAFKSMVGDFTSGASGEKLGNLFGAGGTTMQSDKANAGGLMPTTPQGAVAFEQATKEANIAWAAEDRLTLSPFDISNKNTFLGSIFDSLIPYTAYSGGTVASSLGLLSGLFNTSFGSIFRPALADSPDDPSDWQQCDDPGIQDSGLAAGPFCNVAYVASPQSLSADPVDVINQLGSGNIDSDGNPVDGSDYKKWIDTCANGTDDSTVNDFCSDSNTDPKKQLYITAYLDLQANGGMNGEDDVDSSGSSGSDNSGGDTATPGGTTTGGDDGYSTQCGQYLTGSASVYCPGNTYGNQCTGFVNFELAKHGVIKQGQLVSGTGGAIVGNLGASPYNFTVNTTPAVNAVMSTYDTSNSKVGHTAIVSKVNSDGSFVVKQYNIVSLAYSTTTYTPTGTPGLYTASGGGWSNGTKQHLTFAHTETKWQ